MPFQDVNKLRVLWGVNRKLVVVNPRVTNRPSEYNHDALNNVIFDPM